MYASFCKIYIYSKHAFIFFLSGHFVFLCLIIKIVKTLTKGNFDCNNHKYQKISELSHPDQEIALYLSNSSKEVSHLAD